MSNEINYKNNPLNGVGLKSMLSQLVDHYGFEILHAYLNINCFKNNPSVGSSQTFLKKTEWAREKVEAFYLYQFKNLPKATYEQLEVPPRDRIIPDEQQAGEPAKLSLADAERLNAEKEERAKRHQQHQKHRFSSAKPYPKNNRKKEPTSTSSQDQGAIDPWSKWRK